MVGDNWLAHRVTVAVRTPGILITVGSLIGIASALVPSGFSVYPGGAGLSGGVCAACIGMAALTPTLLTFLVSSAVGKEDDGRITTAYFLAGVNPLQFRLGACCAALVQWTVLVAAAMVAGAMTGLGDGMRMSRPLGDVRSIVVASLLLIFASAYVAVLTAGVSVNSGGRVRNFAVNYGFQVMFFILLATGRGNATAKIAEYFPFAPLWALLPTEVTGRFSLVLSGSQIVIVGSVWTVLAMAGFVRCVRRGGLVSVG